MNTQKTTIRDSLHEKGLKATPIRIAILTFLKQQHGPFTIQEIHKGVQDGEHSTSFDLVTLYRNMEKFVSAKLVSECRLKDGTSRFELSCPTHHHHLVCTSCNRIEPMFYCPVNVTIPNEIAQGYRNISHKLEFYGICPNC